MTGDVEPYIIRSVAIRVSQIDRTCMKPVLTINACRIAGPLTLLLFLNVSFAQERDVAAEFIFIIDTSSSMSGARIFAAKRELVRAIGELPDDVQFNIVAFNN